MKKSTFYDLMTVCDEKGAGYLVLIDPDKQSVDDMIHIAELCEQQGADGLLVGGSLLFSLDFDARVKALKEAVSIPVVLFPGTGMQLSAHADAMLFLSLISGRNPHFLIGEQVHAAPMIRAMDLETISTAYMLVESGITTAAQFMSNTMPLPRHKPEIAVAHGLAAQYMGMAIVYLEGGSGAEQSVPDAIIHTMSKYVELPLIVGGGIKTPEEARQKVEAGASFIVTGTVIENNHDQQLIHDFAQAIHVKDGSA